MKKTLGLLDATYSAGLIQLKYFLLHSHFLYKWYHQVHLGELRVEYLEAHKMFGDVKESLWDLINILTFKAWICPNAHLKSVLYVTGDFDKFYNHITKGVTNCHSRQEMLHSTSAAGSSSTCPILESAVHCWSDGMGWLGMVPETGKHSYTRTGTTCAF